MASRSRGSDAGTARGVAVAALKITWHIIGKH